MKDYMRVALAVESVLLIAVSILSFAVLNGTMQAPSTGARVLLAIIINIGMLYSASYCSRKKPIATSITQ